MQIAAQAAGSRLEVSWRRRMRLPTMRAICSCLCVAYTGTGSRVSTPGDMISHDTYIVWPRRARVEVEVEVEVVVETTDVGFDSWNRQRPVLRMSQKCCPRNANAKTYASPTNPSAYHSRVSSLESRVFESTNDLVDRRPSHQPQHGNRQQVKTTPEPDC